MRAGFVATLAGIALASFAVVAQAAAPAAPVVTVGADIKQLQFDWAQVPGSNTYELWFKANDGAAWVKYTQISAAMTPRIRINASVHLLDWRQAKYRVAACNPSGCTNSGEVGVADLPLEAMGYFKPNAAGNNSEYGMNVALSADGTTFAVISGETIGSAMHSAVVNVYRKTTPTSGWRREARLVPSSVQSSTAPLYMGGPLALSGDGSLLVLGLMSESPPGTGTAEGAGAVYLFRRVGTTWHQEQKLAGEDSYQNWFGLAVDVDDAGSTLAVWARHTIQPQQFGFTEIFRHTASGWVFDHSIPHVPAGQSYLQTCWGMALSGDGRTLVRSCSRTNGANNVQIIDTTKSAPGATLPLVYNDQGSIDINGDGTRLAVRDGPSIGIYSLANGAWTLEDSLSQNSGTGQLSNIALSRDGKILAVGDERNSRAGTGPQYPPLAFSSGTPSSGAVQLYERKSSGWSLRRMVKPGSETAQQSGHTVALGDNGKILAAGAPFDSSAATGIDGDRADTSAPERGAAWLY